MKASILLKSTLILIMILIAFITKVPDGVALLMMIKAMPLFPEFVRLTLLIVKLAQPGKVCLKLLLTLWVKMLRAYVKMVMIPAVVM